MSSKSKVYFYTDKVTLPLRNRTRIKATLERLFRKERMNLKNLTYIFCSDKRILEINQSFLNHNYYTDIITFDLSEGPHVVGEIYISVDRVRDNAKILQVPLQNELTRVILHGGLHLCGYDDKTRRQKEEMRKQENHWILAVEG